MKFKLDENFGTRTSHLFSSAGHDVQTVRDENLSGAPDKKLFEECSAEERCLITLDLDFTDVTRFPPEHSGGIVVLRLPRNPSLPLLEKMIGNFLQSMGQLSPARQLWIVEPAKIRIHQSGVDEQE